MSAQTRAAGGLRHPGRVVFGILLLPAALGLRAWAAYHTDWVENVYSRVIYPTFATLFATLFGVIPVSVAEILLIVLVVLFVVRLVLCLKRLPGTGPVGLWHGFLRLASFCCALYFLFVALWGLNYARAPLAENLGYTTGQPTEAELTALLSQEIASVNAISPQLTYDKSGHSYEDGGFTTVQSRVRDAFGRITADSEPTDNVMPHVPAYPKSVFPSTLLARLGILGIYVPFTFEPTVDAGYPDFMLPFTAAHESAHLRGFAREEEANFWAYLACNASPDIYFQYSGHMNAILYLDSALAATNSAAAQQQMQTLNAQAQADFSDYDTFTKTYQGKLTQVSDAANDTYLKSNGQAGTVSYDAFVDLLCDRYRTQQAAK